MAGLYLDRMFDTKGDTLGHTADLSVLLNESGDDETTLSFRDASLFANGGPRTSTRATDRDDSVASSPAVSPIKALATFGGQRRQQGTHGDS